MVCHAKRDPLEKTLNIQPDRNVNFMYVDNLIGQGYLELRWNESMTMKCWWELACALKEATVANGYARRSGKGLFSFLVTLKAFQDLNSRIQNRIQTLLFPLTCYFLLLLFLLTHPLFHFHS